MRERAPGVHDLAKGAGSFGKGPPNGTNEAGSRASVTASRGEGSRDRRTGDRELRKGSGTGAKEARERASVTAFLARVPARRAKGARERTARAGSRVSLAAERASGVHDLAKRAGPLEKGPRGRTKGGSPRAKVVRVRREGVGPRAKEVGARPCPFCPQSSRDTFSASPMRRRVGWLGLVGLMIAIASIAACRQLVGITDNPPEDLVTSICGLPYGTNTCASCVNTNCCAESTTCAEDPACSAYEGCLGNCNGDPKCRSQCTTYPVYTGADVSALSACLAANCETACGLECGGVAPYVSPPDAAASCQTCVAQTTSNCSAAKACGSSEACDAYLRCFLACFTTDCRQACVSANVEGAALFASFQSDPNGPLTYFGGACSGPCGAGSDWACVGHVVWPSPTSPTVALTGKVVDNQSRIPVSGLNVAYCGACPCPSPADPLLGNAQTDDAGIYSVQIPNSPGMGDTGLNGCAQYHPDPDSGITPEFV